MSGALQVGATLRLSRVARARLSAQLAERGLVLQALESGAHRVEVLACPFVQFGTLPPTVGSTLEVVSVWAGLRAAYLAADASQVPALRAWLIAAERAVLDRGVSLASLIDALEGREVAA